MEVRRLVGSSGISLNREEEDVNEDGSGGGGKKAMDLRSGLVWNR